MTLIFKNKLKQRKQFKNKIRINNKLISQFKYNHNNIKFIDKNKFL